MVTLNVQLLESIFSQTKSTKILFHHLIMLIAQMSPRPSIPLSLLMMVMLPLWTTRVK